MPYCTSLLEAGFRTRAPPARNHIERMLTPRRKGLEKAAPATHRMRDAGFRGRTIDHARHVLILILGYQIDRTSFRARRQPRPTHVGTSSCHAWLEDESDASDNQEHASTEVTGTAASVCAELDHSVAVTLVRNTRAYLGPEEGGEDSVGDSVGRRLDQGHFTISWYGEPKGGESDPRISQFGYAQTQHG